MTETRRADATERRPRRTLTDEHLTAAAGYQTARGGVLDWPAVLAGRRRVVLAGRRRACRRPPEG